MLSTAHDRQPAYRFILLVIGGAMLGMTVLSLVPLLMQGASLRREPPPVHPIRLTAEIPEPVLEDPPSAQEPPPEPPRPPEPEITMDQPELPEIQPPDVPPPPAPEPAAASPRPVSVASPLLTPSVVLPSLARPSVKVAAVSSLTKGLSLDPPKAPVPGVRPSVKPPPPRIRFTMDEVDRLPVGISTLQPVYPFRARRLAIEGHVSVRFLVDRDGGVKDLAILDAQPGNVFEQSVASTLVRWRFKPARKDGKPVETWIKTTIRFKLENDS